jgi:hypothetical protein
MTFMQESAVPQSLPHQCTCTDGERTMSARMNAYALMKELYIYYYFLSSARGRLGVAARMTPMKARR